MNVIFNEWGLTARLIHSLKGKFVMFAEHFFQTTLGCFFFFACFKPTGSKEMIIEKYCAGANVVCLADSIRACGCSHRMKHGESKCKSILQSYCVLMFHCKPTVDSKSWSLLLLTNLACLCSFQETWTSTYPKGMWSQWSFFFLLWLQIWVCLQPAGFERRQSKQSSVWNCAPYIRQKLS